MQGPPPLPPPVMAASPFSSPPIKKQRASGTPLQTSTGRMMMMHQPASAARPPPPQQQQAVSQKRAQLLKLAQTNPRNPQQQPLLPASALVSQARSSLGMAPPPPMTTAFVSSFGSATTENGTTNNNNANHPHLYPHHHHYKSGSAAANHGGSNSSGGGGFHNIGNTTTNRQPGSALRGGGRPTTSPSSSFNHHPTNPENSVPHSPRPTVVMNPIYSNSSTSNHLSSPVSPRSTVADAAAAATATVTVSTSSTSTPELIDARLARRLGSEFAHHQTGGSTSASAALANSSTSSSSSNSNSNIPTPSRSKSAPPSRKAPPPPPTPKPRAQEEPAKSVSFQSPEDTSFTARQPETPEVTNGGPPPATPAPSNYRLHAGATPAPPRIPVGNNSSTSFSRSALATPTTQDKQDMLRHLQDMADTPRSTVSTPDSTTTSTAASTTTTTTSVADISPELRLQQHLAITAKEKAEAFKKVAQLEGQIVKDKSNSVTFESPLLGPKSEPKRYIKSPMPKRLTSRFSANGPPAAPADDPVLLKAAASSVPFEFTRDDRTFTVRRPYGLAGGEQELWCKVGHLPAKVYERQANVDDETSFEVAATCDDGSILNLYGEYLVRHHTVDEGPQEYENQSLSTMLGSIAYVDDNGVDQQYSLDDIWGTAMEVRGLYRTSLRAAADALLMAPSSLSSSVPANNGGTIPLKTTTTTVDAGMTTDPVPKSKDTTPGPPPTPPVMDDESDAFATTFRYCFQCFFWLIFLVVKTCYQCMIVTIYLAIAYVILSILYLQMKDDFATDEMGAVAKVYQSGGGIV